MHAMFPAAAIAAACFVPAATTGAQASFVSPVTATTTEGSSGNIFPFASPVVRRYQQIHSDIKLSGAIKSMACRVNGSTSTYSGVRAIDMELYMGYGAGGHDQMSQVFDQNYLANSKQLVLKRQVVNLGPQGQNTSPGVFTGMQITFDTPFPYPAALPLLWEAVIYSNTVSGGSFQNMDADASTITNGSLTTTGSGCVATGRTSAMSQSAFIQDLGGALSYAVGTANGPASAPVVLSIGAANPNLILPGILCGGLYTDLLMSFPIGTTSTTGALANTMGLGLSLPNTFGGLQFFSQQHALDLGLSELLKVANSNGQQVTVPMANPAKSVKVSRMTNNVGGTTATSGLRFNGSSIGYGLVTRFDF